LHDAEFYSVDRLISWQCFSWQLTVSFIQNEILPANCFFANCQLSFWGSVTKLANESDLVKNKKTETVLQNYIFSPLRQEH